MNFIKYVPSKINPAKELRIKFFSYNNSPHIDYFDLSFGKYIAEHLNVKVGDRISFYYEEKDKRIWFIKKTDKYEGYVLTKRSKETFKIRMKVPTSIFTPTEKDMNCLIKKYDFYEDGVRIY